VYWDQSWRLSGASYPGRVAFFYVYSHRGGRRSGCMVMGLVFNAPRATCSFIQPHALTRSDKNTGKRYHISLSFSRRFPKFAQETHMAIHGGLGYWLICSHMFNVEAGSL